MISTWDYVNLTIKKRQKFILHLSIEKKKKQFLCLGGSSKISGLQIQVFIQISLRHPNSPCRWNT